jgi:hypothetical protein
VDTEEVKERQQKRSQDRDDEEQQVPLDRLIKEGRWGELKNNDEYQSRSIKDRVLLAKKAVNVRLDIANTMFAEVVKTDTQDAQTILDEEIKPLRNLIGALNKRYVGTLREEDTPDEMTKVLRIPAGNALEKIA